MSAETEKPVSETYLSVGDGTGCFYLSNARKGRVYVFGVRELHPDNLIVIELGRRVFGWFHKPDKCRKRGV